MNAARESECRRCGRRIHPVERLADSWEDEYSQMVCRARGGGPHVPVTHGTGALADATARELLDALRERTRGGEPLARSQLAEARHVIRYAYQDLHGLHTELERMPHRWSDVVAELDTQISRLEALREYLIPGPQRKGVSR